jgi:hypothetical protein
MAAIKVVTNARLNRWKANGDIANVRKATAAGTRKLLPKIEETVRQKLISSGIPAGQYTRSITSKAYDSGTGVVKSNDPRKLREWLETGRRRGVKTKRKGSYGWRAGKTAARSAIKAGFYEPEFARYLRD